MREYDYDSQRWGGGLDPELFSLPSFESLHYRCVSAARYLTPDALTLPDETETEDLDPEDVPLEVETSYKYVERFKFDLALTDETSLSDVIDNRALASANAFRVMRDGKMHVGITPPGQMAVAYLGRDQIAEDSETLSFGDAAPPNRIRVQYSDLRDEYRQDFAETEDAFGINASARVLTETISIGGISRPGHAQTLSAQILGQATNARRTAGGVTHFMGLAFSCDDLITLDLPDVGVDKELFALTDLREDEEGKITFTAVEHAPLRPRLRQTIAASPVPPRNPLPGPGGDPEGPEECVTTRVSATEGDVRWFGGGAVFPPGNFMISYVEGAVKVSPAGGYSVAGYELVTVDDDGAVIVLDQTAPAATTPSGGWATKSEAEAANTGKYLAFTVLVEGPIGLRPTTAVYPNGTDNTVYKLCYDPDGDDGDPTPPPSGDAYIICDDTRLADCPETLGVSFTIAGQGSYTATIPKTAATVWYGSVANGDVFYNVTDGENETDAQLAVQVQCGLYDGVLEWHVLGSNLYSGEAQEIAYQVVTGCPTGAFTMYAPGAIAGFDNFGVTS